MLIGDKHDNWDILRKCSNFLLCMLHWNLWKTLLVTNLHVLFYSPYKPYSSPEELVCLCPGRREAQPQETVLRLLASAVVAVPKLRLSGLWVRGRCRRVAAVSCSGTGRAVLGHLLTWKAIPLQPDCLKPHPCGVFPRQKTKSVVGGGFQGHPEANR